MSSTPNSAEAWRGDHEPGAPQQHTVAETWPVEARLLLAVAVVTLAIGLLTVCQDCGSSSRNAFAVAPILVLDPNSAPPQVLEALPTLGPTLVRRWVVARAERRFSSLADARRRVRGLGPASLAQIAPYLRFEPRPDPPTDDYAGADAASPSGESIKTADVAGERVDDLIGRR